MVICSPCALPKGKYFLQDPALIGPPACWRAAATTTRKWPRPSRMPISRAQRKLARLSRTGCLASETGPRHNRKFVPQSYPTNRSGPREGQLSQHLQIHDPCSSERRLVGQQRDTEIQHGVHACGLCLGCLTLFWALYFVHSGRFGMTFAFCIQGMRTRRMPPPPPPDFAILLCVPDPFHGANNQQKVCDHILPVLLPFGGILSTDTNFCVFSCHGTHPQTAFILVRVKPPLRVIE